MVKKVERLNEEHIILTGIGRTVDKKDTSHANTCNLGYKSMLVTERHIADNILK